ncbi:hypothetical protein BKA70DRAFT_1220041 [Coprinopsis sp. MPI-PUGE-AT-0042]|nr:hypothetical protein BKA70DRAFT_1220041 [Coprinopsis sp. MPI-PUGE-AT-0042]
MLAQFLLVCLNCSCSCLLELSAEECAMQWHGGIAKIAAELAPRCSQNVLKKSWGTERGGQDFLDRSKEILLEKERERKEWVLTVAQVTMPTSELLGRVLGSYLWIIPEDMSCLKSEGGRDRVTKHSIRVEDKLLLQKWALGLAAGLSMLHISGSFQEIWMEEVQEEKCTCARRRY